MVKNIILRNANVHLQKLNPRRLLMNLIKAIITICFCAALCEAKTIIIRGTVQDSAGKGISEATVKLKNAGLSTTTGTDGSFTLTGIVSIKTIPGPMSNAVTIQNGRITISLTEDAEVSECVFNISGRQVSRSKVVYKAGSHIIRPSLQASGVFLYKIIIADKTYLYKATLDGAISSMSKKEINHNELSMLVKQSKVTSVMNDVILVTKDGQIDYADSMRTSDTSGIVIKMTPNAGNITDVDGNIYQSVRIGSQIWTVQNLRVTRYNNDSAITLDTSSKTWNCNTEKYCFHDNSTNTAFQNKWGAYYNWYAVNTGKLAPSGWHVPTDAEWDTLENYLIANGYNYDGTTTGKKFAKSLAAKTDWYSYDYSNTGAPDTMTSWNNSSGFLALPGGYRDLDGGFKYQGTFCGWWSATGSVDTLGAYGRYLNSSHVHMSTFINGKSTGHTVRLLRD